MTVVESKQQCHLSVRPSSPLQSPMMSQLHQLNQSPPLSSPMVSHLIQWHLSLLKPHLSLLKPRLSSLSPQSFWFFGYPVPILEMESLEMEENRTVTT